MQVTLDGVLSGNFFNPVITGTAKFPDGSATLPSITNAGDLNTGMWFGHADTINLSVAGAEIAEFDATSINFATDFHVDNGNGIVIGHTAQQTVNGTLPEFAMYGTASQDTQHHIGRWSNDSGSAELYFMKSRATAIGTDTIVQDDDSVGAIAWWGNDGTDFENLGALFVVEVDDGSPAANDVGMAYVWKNAGGGGVAVRETMRLDAAGDLTLGGDIDLGDNQQIRLGDGDDVLIDWDGTDLEFTGPSDFVTSFQSNNLKLDGTTIKEFYMTDTSDGFGHGSAQRGQWTDGVDGVEAIYSQGFGSGALCIITGVKSDDSTTAFLDLVIMSGAASDFGAGNILHSEDTRTGATPAARTYSMSAERALKLAMASGQYDISVTALS